MLQADVFYREAFEVFFCAIDGAVIHDNQLKIPAALFSTDSTASFRNPRRLKVGMITEIRGLAGINSMLILKPSDVGNFHSLNLGYRIGWVNCYISDAYRLTNK